MIPCASCYSLTTPQYISDSYCLLSLCPLPVLSSRHGFFHCDPHPGASLQPTTRCPKTFTCPIQSSHPSLHSNSKRLPIPKIFTPPSHRPFIVLFHSNTRFPSPPVPRIHPRISHAPPPLFPLSAGNLACDAVQGGRLIYYDFGMMDEFQPGVKKGLVSC